ncbi:peptidylprolyl isomerase [Arthrobacter monumenti]
MSPKSRQQQMRLRLERMEAKQSLRSEQIRRRRRDNLVAAIAVALVGALALVLQLTTFRTNPTAAQMAAIEQSMQVPSDGSSEDPSDTPAGSPSAASAPPSDNASSPPSTAGSNGTNIPDPSLAAGKTFTGTIETNFGPIEVWLDGGKAPQAVSVFKSLTEQGYFEGSTCHRLTDSPSLNVLQCGSENGDGASDPDFAWGPVENAPEDGKYPAGTIAVARGSGEYSHGKQFFIVYEDSTIPPSSGGYTIMGLVTDGLDVVKEIAANGLKSSGTSPTDGAPKDPVTIDSFTLN